ncbi:hypothetical protein [Flavobacterium pallidum]|uniref:Uncharacterized protein n=1 Tax=Flavobacterium pallidum TaxID=2172098 RepID=A0A2S1SJF1_9FLAO|nr:hypothetical protein [Flavobacterium pallidum]AWI26469.1 hypothetical protein HYN49_11450 [Flavobacterium pallidum]
MTQTDPFQELKKEVLLEYMRHYPYFQGSWKNFSSQDIQNLILLIEQHLKERISEKWIYTHLKPETNEKLPRKDMLDILSRFVGYSGWDEFRLKDLSAVELKADRSQIWKKRRLIIYAILMLIMVSGLAVYFYPSDQKKHTIELKDEFTKKNLRPEDVKIYQIEDNKKIPLEIRDEKVEVTVNKGKSTKIVIESPYYQNKTVEIKQPEQKQTEVLMKPDDYAMMLKAFMLSDVKDWQTRKQQLDKILADDVEVLLMLRDNLGTEYMNKQEFSGKIVIPTDAVRKMKIVEINNNKDNRINFIRITQE